MNQTVIGYFDTRAEAQEAVQRLSGHGFSSDRVKLSDEPVVDKPSTVSSSMVGAETGGISGFFGSLFGGGSNDHVSRYEEGVKRGGSIVMVDVSSEEEAEQISDLLESCGAADIEERANQWGTTTLAAPVALAAATGTAATATTLQANQSQAIPIVKETLEVGKRTVGTGGVRVVSRTVAVPVNESVTLREEHAVVQRRAVDRPVTEADLASFEDRTIEVRETAEKAVVSKTARVVEEVMVGKQSTQRTETIKDTVRHTEVDVQKLSADTTPSTARDFDDDAAAYRTDYESRYSKSGGSYDEYEPNYRYGHTLASNDKYSGKKWSDIESDVKSDWMQKNPGGTWDKVKGGVQHAWDKATA